jgi:2-aminoethylphosphonate-pyruvate transaminase/(2-aminoethyl)phosphonate cytidylyltransferase
MPSTRTAVILAAGLGLRLRPFLVDQPKGLLVVGGMTLVTRSLAALRAHGVERVLIVAGYRAQQYHRLARGEPAVTVVENREFEQTGSMASLDVALDRVDEDFLLLESDLFYDPIALQAVFAHPARDVVLASAATGAGDEVWVEVSGDRVSGLSKDRTRLHSVDGEYVGIVRVSTELARLLRSCFHQDRAARGTATAAYDTDVLAAAVGRHRVSLCVVPDLLWGEVDHAGHYDRVSNVVYPAWAARAGVKGAR